MVKKQDGFIGVVVLVVILLIILGYLGVNIPNIVNSPTVSGNLHYAWSLLVSLWDNVLVGPATFIWNKIVVDLIWNNLLHLINQAQPAATQ